MCAKARVSVKQKPLEKRKNKRTRIPCRPLSGYADCLIPYSSWGAVLRPLQAGFASEGVAATSIARLARKDLLKTPASSTLLHLARRAKQVCPCGGMKSAAELMCDKQAQSICMLRCKTLLKRKRRKERGTDILRSSTELVVLLRNIKRGRNGAEGSCKLGAKFVATEC